MSIGYERYAIYWVPAVASKLANFGCAWTGWCAEEGSHYPRMRARELPRPLEQLTAETSRHGLHGIYKAPFALSRGRSHWGLERVVQSLAEEAAPIACGGLRLAVVGGRVALLPIEPPAGLNRLVARIGRAMLAYDTRAVARRMGFEDQAEPFQAEVPEPTGAVAVVDAHRFHLPLTDRLDLGDAYAVVAYLRPLLAPILAQSLVLGDLALVGDPGGNRPWRVIDRHPLVGATARRGARVYEPFAIDDTNGPRPEVV